MKTATSDASGDFLERFTVPVGQICRAKIEFPASGSSGPTGGTVGVYHHDSDDTIIARDENGTAAEKTATGTALGAEFTIVAATDELRFVGAGLGDSKVAKISLAFVR